MPPFIRIIHFLSPCFMNLIFSPRVRILSWLRQQQKPQQQRSIGCRGGISFLPLQHHFCFYYIRTSLVLAVLIHRVSFYIEISTAMSSSVLSGGRLLSSSVLRFSPTPALKLRARDPPCPRLACHLPTHRSFTHPTTLRICVPRSTLRIFSAYLSLSLSPSLPHPSPPHLYLDAPRA